MKPPVLTYVCGDCGTPLRMSCDDCETLEHEARDRDRQTETSARAWMLEVPGVRALGEAIGSDVMLDTSEDEDGRITYSATVTVRGEHLTAYSDSPILGHAAAVQGLKGIVVDFMRDWASHINELDFNEDATP